MSLTASQIEARKAGVGCSELLAALGKDSRCSRLELYLRKRGELPDPDFSDDQRVHFGNVLEPALRREASRRLGRKVIVPRQTLVHPGAPLLGHPDGWLPAVAQGLEIKTADKFEAEEFGEPESDQVPVRYLVQCAGYMALTGADRWHLGVLIGGNDFRMYEIPRDAELEAAILAGVREFWSHVDDAKPPAMMTPDDVRLRWPKSLQDSVVASPEIESDVHQHAQLKARMKEAEKREDEIKADIQGFMAEAGDLVAADGTLLATWRSAKGSRVLDEKRLKAERPDIWEAFAVDKPGSRRFLNKLTKRYEE